MEIDKTLQAKLDTLANEHASDFRLLSPLESAVIKGHILVERELSRAIASAMPSKKAYNLKNYTFSRKIVLADKLGLIPHCKTELLALNSLRNKIAHHLSFDPLLISKFVWEVYQKSPKTFDKYDKNIELLTMHSISFLCGSIAAISTIVTNLKHSNQPTINEV